MPQSLEERVAYLEVKVDEHTRGFVELTFRIDALDQKVDRFRAELASRLDALDQKISRQFVWLVGIQIAVLLAVIGALLR